MANTILLKGRGHRLEKVAAGTITPGMLVEITSADKLQAHSSAGGYASKAFAVENDMEGKEITVDYAANDFVQAEIMGSGDEVLAFLVDGGTAVVIGDLLESAGDGSLQKRSTGVALAVALEAVDNSGGSDPARIQTRIL